ncbi:hypothetical protein IID10_21275, partial [candidate division KSB1 bacterium]|nr:hypothetical protein [candidate division KSB1 bacterium]
MSFISLPSLDEADDNYGGAYVGPEGDPNAKICFIGEAPARDELRTGRPFMGEAGRLFEHCLHKAGLLRGEVYITNFSKYPISKTKMGSGFTVARGIKA